MQIGATVTIVCEDDLTEPAPYFGTLISIMGAEEGETASYMTANQIEDAKQAGLGTGTFWNMFVVDALIGNADRLEAAILQRPVLCMDS